MRRVFQEQVGGKALGNAPEIQTGLRAGRRGSPEADPEFCTLSLCTPCVAVNIPPHGSVKTGPGSRSGRLGSVGSIGSFEPSQSSQRTGPYSGHLFEGPREFDQPCDLFPYNSLK